MTRALSVRKEQSRGIVPAEGNFEEHPYFRVGDRNAGTGIMHFENELRTRDGNVMQQSWIVRAAHGRGLPGRYDQDVYVALMQLIDAKGLPPDGWVSFSVYELVELMGKRHSGREYRQVRESLQRLATTSVESKNAFYHKGRKAYISDTFSLLTEVKLAEYEEIAGERKDRNRVHLSQYFVDSYRANYLKHIDARFYWSLSSPIAKRLYRLVDKKRGGRRSWEVELFSLKSRIPLSDYRYASKIKEKLAPAHEELISQGFLKSVSYRKSEGREYAAYELTEEFHARRVAVAARALSTEEIFCVQRLQAEGMARETAEGLVATHGTSRVMHYVEALPHQKNIRNPAGWLKKAIESNYELDRPPALFGTSQDGFLSPVPEAHPLEGPPEPNSVKGPVPAAPERLRPDPAAQEAWEQIVTDIEERTDVSALRIWFEGIFGAALEGKILTVAAPNSFAKEYIETRFGDVLEEAFAGRAGEEAKLKVIVGERA